MPGSPKDASTHTSAANAARELGFDRDDFARASRGLVATAPDRSDRRAVRTGVGLHAVRRSSSRASANPPTVNPSLWRQAQLNNIHGLFEVDDGVYQVRGFDLSNITFIAGDTGWIVIDPLTVGETAARRSS